MQEMACESHIHPEDKITVTFFLETPVHFINIFFPYKIKRVIFHFHDVQKFSPLFSRALPQGAVSQYIKSIKRNKKSKMKDAGR
jgi:hypothetical protein